MSTTMNPPAAEEESRLSTQPAAPDSGPQKPGFAALIKRSWRRLTSMRTALLLLFLLAVAAIPGSLLPQRSSDLTRVDNYLVNHKTAGPIMDRLQLFDVFGSPWFAAIYLLLMVSLIGCLVPRWKLHLRAMRRKPPRTPARLKRLAFHEELQTALPAAEAAELAKKALRRKGFRVASYDEGRSVSAEKGFLRETGNLCFHVAIVALLIGIAYGSFDGYQADRVLMEVKGTPTDAVSQTIFTNTVAQYDDVKLGRLENPSSLDPWSIQLQEFDATYQPGTTTAKDYNAHVIVKDSPTAAPRDVDIKINHPLQLGSTKVYLLNHGYVPTFRLKGPSGFVDSQPVVCPPTAPMTLLSHCVVVFADLPVGEGAKKTTENLGFTVDFAPTGELDATSGITSTNPRLLNPDALVTAYTGNLGLTEEHSIYQLNTAQGKAVGPPQNIDVNSKDPTVNKYANLPGGYSLDIAGISQWASFQTKRDPGKPIVLLAAITMIAGVLASLRVRRRRVWVRATEQPSGTQSELPSGQGDAENGQATGSGAQPAVTLVEVGGLARTDADGFAEEFPRLVARVGAAVGAQAAQTQTDGG